MPIEGRVYRCWCWDAVLQEWEVGNDRYTLAALAKLTPEAVAAEHTGRLMGR